MLITLLGLLSVFLIVMVTGPAAAGTINVLGFVDIGPGSLPTGGVFNLGGDRGFTLDGGAQFFTSGLGAECSGVPTACSPGMTFSLQARSGGSDIAGFTHGTLDGVSYPRLGGAGCPLDFVPCADLDNIEFKGQAVAPPFGEFSKATVKAPVDFFGSFRTPGNTPRAFGEGRLGGLCHCNGHAAKERLPRPSLAIRPHSL
jgi:hypothetical protein